MNYYCVEVSGVVQGVGFRPFVYRLALEHGISGNVANTRSGVRILAGGTQEKLDSFLMALQEEAPPAAIITGIAARRVRPFELATFSITASAPDGVSGLLISPDIATCDACLEELFDGSDRRYRYPFTNCTNCGPRYTITLETPYDRVNTTMAGFSLCERCSREYEDPLDRRFHAQPNACPECGPQVMLVDGNGTRVPGDPFLRAAEALVSGRVIALKGIGGYQLACDATSGKAVGLLRERKGRYGKPLAVMVADMKAAKENAVVGRVEEGLLLSAPRPVLLLPKRDASTITEQVAPGLSRIGVFLPYSPLHHLFLSACGRPIVMSSGNYSGEPIAKGNEEAMERLGTIADLFLVHDRGISVRYDDSVSTVLLGGEYPVRRARGYAPYPVTVTPAASIEVLATGAEQKNCFCCLRGEHAFVSQHIGDMQTVLDLEHYEEALASMKELFALEPALVAHDLHPDYMSTRIAEETGLPRIGVQHHHAHIASCMADNGLDGEVIGVAWDGTGYGEDGTAWGGEFLVAGFAGYRRIAHLQQFPMPGSDACITDPRRMVAGMLAVLTGSPSGAIERMGRLFKMPAGELEAVRFQLEKIINTPMTSSAGRYFDIVAALTGVRCLAEYDGQPAAELEAVAQRTTRHYRYSIDRGGSPWVVRGTELFAELMLDIDSGVGYGEVSGRFHNSMANLVLETVSLIAEETGLRQVCLSGGVFQNLLLTDLVVRGLSAAGLETYAHRQVPCNDGGIALGQAVVAANVYNE